MGLGRVSIKRIVLINIFENGIVVSCKVIQVFTFSFNFGYQTFKVVNVFSFNFIVPMFFNPIDELYAHVDFTLSYHVPKLRIIHVSVLFLHV